MLQYIYYYDRFNIAFNTVDQTKEEEENPYPGIPTGCCRFLVATMDTINKFKDTDTLWGKVNHVINYVLPNNIEEYRHRVGLMNNSETVVYMIFLKYQYKL